MRSLPPLKALRAFEAAARHESVMKAATELNVSHSAVSQQIKNLEAYFGEKLFQRYGRGVILTPKAREFLTEVHFCFDRLVHASEYLRSGRRCAKLTVNVTPSFAVRWLIPRITRFQHCYPGVEIQVETSVTDDINGLARGSELIIRRHNMVRPGMICQRILEDVSVAVIAPDLWESVRVKHPSGLAALPLLHMKSRMPAWPQWFEAAGVRAHAAVSGPVYDHFFLSLEAAIRGCGIALCPRILVEEDLSKGLLVEVFKGVTVEGSGFYCFYEPNLADGCIPVAVQWLLEEGEAHSREQR